ncbi:MAG: hypothetical protein DRI90_22735 [Deltaproteobacteria bacterium]|nr:MAG: hypothetical protein DRI90_22735 [Deltaproteobacteria bacterium]
MCINGVCVDPPNTGSETTWDVASDFSTTANPNGPYSYGLKPSLEGVFLQHDTVDPGISGCALSILDWHSSALPSREPVVAKNISSDTTCNGVLPGAVNLHPGPDGELSVLRWASPVNGQISIEGHFGAGDTSPMSYFIYKNDSLEIYSLHGASGDGSFSIVESVPVGTTIDFLVGEYFAYGSTPLQAAIQIMP